MTSQASVLKDNYFLNLLDNDLHNIKLLYIKESLQIKYFGHSNLLCTRATQAITSYAPIGEYCPRFFLRESFSCLCRSYPIETRCHILYNCRRSNKYWNLIRDTISQLVAFLEFNPSSFSFHEDITQYNSLICLLHTQLLSWFLFLFFFFYFFFLSFSLVFM